MQKTTKIIMMMMLLLLSVFFIGCKDIYEDEPKEDDPVVEEPKEEDNIVSKTIAYIPLDDRPVNTTRAIYMAGSAGFEVLLPEKDYYTTKLDGQPLNSNNTQYGNVEELLKWIKEINASYYVISLDQILSGGLVNSRIMYESDLTKTYQTIDEIFELFIGKKVVLFDTVMRLASTVGYQGYESDEYNALRNYGSIARASLIGDYTVTDIVDGYKYDTSNNLISSTLSSQIIDKYLKARERKIKIANYCLNKAKNNQDIYIYYGIDDSSPKTTIQTNEINYIKKHLTNGTIFAGTDELGLMSITKLIKMHYQSNTGVNVKAKLTYFGSMKSEPADSYDIASLEENVNSHIESLDIDVVEEDYDLEVLILTKKKGSTTTYNHIYLLNKYKENVKNKVPTIIIDASTSSQYGKIQARFISDQTLNLSYMIGYSSWNTVGNAIGIALSNGISRYLYLNYETKKSLHSDEEFIKTLAFSFFKDISYKIAGQGRVKDYIDKNVGSNSNFYSESLDLESIEKETLEILLNGNFEMSINDFIFRLYGSNFITNLIEYKESTIEKINVTGVHFPWYRTFEIDYDLECSVK